MPSWKQKEIIKALSKKGFKKCSDDHVGLSLWVDGKEVDVRTFVSHSKKFTISPRSGVFHAMKRQLHLDRVQLELLLSCPMTKEELVEILKDKGKVP